MRKQKNITIADLANLPDFAILARTQLAAIYNCSEDTLDRMWARGQGPPRIRISPRRLGSTVGSVKQDIAKRLAQAADAGEVD